MLKVDAPIPGTTSKGRPLRACVVQSIMPEAEDFSAADLEMRSPALRRKHSKHLYTALAAVEKMLALRETHNTASKRLAVHIIPEQSVTQNDVSSQHVHTERT